MAKVCKRQKNKRHVKFLKRDFLKVKRWVFNLLTVMMAMIYLELCCAESEFSWHKTDNGIDESKIKSICVIRDNPNVVYAGGQRCIYKSTNCGKDWVRVFMLKGERKGINLIAYNPKNSYRVFAATCDGLYMSPDAGKTWQRLFKGKDDLQRHIFSISIDNSGIILIGTKKGLFQSKDEAKTWIAHSRFINKQIDFITNEDNNIYVCAIDGVYHYRQDADICERIYVYHAVEGEDNNSDTDIANADTDAKEKIKRLNHITIYDGKLHLATDKGIFVYQANVWQIMATEGLLSNDVKFLMPTDNALFAATDKGVFMYSKTSKKWQAISEGLASLHINMLDVSKESIIFAATEKGLYKVSMKDITLHNQTEETTFSGYDFNRVINKEPSILDIQAAAIRYAEVSDRKIEWMRSAARNKALLPTLNVEIDRDVTDLWHWEGGSTTKPDDDILRRGRDTIKWGLSLKWDLDELIWNDEQTDIDVRSRLMVQLRNDILDEVTKLYFERRRLQYELYTSPPLDAEKKVLKEVRLQELTANIDALTDGHLSSRKKPQAQ